MKELILVALGGAGGSVTRYVMSGALLHRYPTAPFPIGTLTVNILGSFLIGAIAGLIEKHLSLSNELRLLIMTGFLGGYTTFSAFSYESLFLMRRGEFLSAVMYISLTVFGCLVATWLGLKITGHWNSISGA